MRARLAACTAAVMTVAAAMPSRLRADPISPDDLAQARQLYADATAAMAEGRYDDAALDFERAYTLTQDPVVFFKIGVANEKAGHCPEAVLAFKRYLDQAHPLDEHVALTQQHLAACGGTDAATPPVGGEAPSAPPAGASAPTAGARTPALIARSRVRTKDIPWVLVGGALAFVVLGSALAYSASSSESDIRDLYGGTGNATVTYNAATAERYHDLIAEGHRYQYFSWASFSIAAGFAAVGTALFLHDRAEHKYAITPSVTRQGAGVGALVQF